MPERIPISRLAPMCLLLAGLLSLPAFAQDSHGLIDAATKDFVALNFEGSLKNLDAALKTKGNRKAALLRIYGLQALCFLSLSKNAEAEQAFTAALSIDPAFRLGPEVSPRFSEPFDKLLQRGVLELAVELAVPAEVSEGQPVEVSVLLVADPAGLSDSLWFYYRRAGQSAFASEQIRLIRGKQTRFLLPAGFARAAGTRPIQWYYAVRDRHGGELKTVGQATPQQIRVRPRQEVLALAPSPPPESVAAPAWYQKWWVWAIIGGVAAAAGTTAAILTTSAEGEANHRDFSIDIR